MGYCVRDEGDEGDRFQAQEGRGGLRKKEKGMMKLGTSDCLAEGDVLRPG